MKQIEVVFCGDSVYLSGLAASLRQSALLRVSQVEASPGEALNDLKLLCPDVVVAEVAEREAVQALLQYIPRLKVIAIAAATDSLTVLGGRQSSASAVTELARVITEYAGRQYAQDRDDSGYYKEEYDER